MAEPGTLFSSTPHPVPSPVLQRQCSCTVSEALADNHCEQLSWSHRGLPNPAETLPSFPIPISHTSFSTTVLFRYQKSQPSCSRHKDEVTSRRAAEHLPSGSHLLGCRTVGHSCQEGTQTVGKWLHTPLRPIPLLFTACTE